MIRRSVVIAAIVPLLAACAAIPSYRDTSVPITSYAAFDPSRYQGTWHEIARYPVPFQAGCGQSKAIYGPADPGRLSVENVCPKNGTESRIRGIADVVGPGRLEVRLGRVPFAGDYWVLWVDEDYSTAVVGVPSGRAGWILNRSPSIAADRFEAARRVLRFNGYRPDDLLVVGEVRP